MDGNGYRGAAPGSDAGSGPVPGSGSSSSSSARRQPQPHAQQQQSPWATSRPASAAAMSAPVYRSMTSALPTAQIQVGLGGAPAGKSPAAVAQYRSLAGVATLPRERDAVAAPAPLRKQSSTSSVRSAGGSPVAPDSFTEGLANLAVRDAVKPSATLLGVPRLPLPLELFPLAATHRWFPSQPAEDVVRRVEASLLAAVGANGSVELKRTERRCCFECYAETEEVMSQSCTFAVNIFDVTGDARAPAQFLVEAERRSGSPYVFQAVMKRIMRDDKLGPHHQVAGAAAVVCAEPARFQPPALPASLDAESEADADADADADAAVESLLGLALSNVHEQRLQATLLFADQCHADPEFARRAARVSRGGARVAPLTTDKNPLVRRAAERIVRTCKVG